MRSWRVDDTDPYTRVESPWNGRDTKSLPRLVWQALRQRRRASVGESVEPRFSGSRRCAVSARRVGIAKKGWSLDAFVLPTISRGTLTGGDRLRPF